MNPDLPFSVAGLVTSLCPAGLTTVVVSSRQPGVTKETPTVSVTNFLTAELSPAGSASSTSMLVPATALLINSSLMVAREALEASLVASEISKEMA